MLTANPTHPRQLSPRWSSRPLRETVRRLLVESRREELRRDGPDEAAERFERIDALKRIVGGELLNFVGDAGDPPTEAELEVVIDMIRAWHRRETRRLGSTLREVAHA